MNHPSLFPLLLVCAALPAAAVACGDDDDGAAPSGRAASGAGGRAGAPAGAGGQAGAAGAAGTGGAAGSGGALDRVMQRVSVRDPDGPRPGADVLAHDEQGAIVGRTKTAADGTAQIEVPTGGSVTFVGEQVEFDDFAPKRIATFYGLDGTFELNHVLTGRASAAGAGGAGGAGGSPPPPPPPSMRLTVTPSPPLGVHPARYRVSLCNWTRFVDFDSSLNETDFDACGNGTYDVLVVAFDEGDKTIGYGTVLDAPLQAGGSASHTVFVGKTDLLERNVTVQLGGDYSNQGFTVRGARDPASSPSMVVYQSGYSNPVISDRFSVPSTLFQRWEFTQFTSASTHSAFSRSHEYFKSALGPPVDIAWSVDAMASFEVLEKVTATSGDDARWPSFRWQFSSPGALGDEAVYEVSHAGVPWSWRVEMPPARSATVRMIALPDDLAAYRPPPDQLGGEMDVSVTLRDYVGIDGWPGRHRGGDASEYHQSSGRSFGPIGRAPAAPAKRGRP